MKKTIFEGVATALITPFRNGKIDFDALGNIIDWQIDSGIDAIVICGTTGEASTLTDMEHQETIAFAVKRVNHRIPVIAGTGSNDTAYALELTGAACQSGVDAVLVTTPYYNKATQRGLAEMYTVIADKSSVPVILYNVPSRTGINIAPTTYKFLADHPNIAAIKEANGDISKIVETMSYVHDKLDLYSGNDDQIVPLMSLGAKGVISVLSNIMPAQTKEIVTSFMKGDVRRSAMLQYQYHAMIDKLFCEVNPIPIKAAMAKMGFCENSLRLPLTTMSEESMNKMFDVMRSLSLVE